jgi:glycosyltransferase involved in cell wall biosynthesis
MPTALVLSFSDLRTDPRVSRQIRWLAGEFAVTAAGLAPPEAPGVRFLPIRRADQSSATSRVLRGLRLLGRFHESAYWSAYGNAFEALKSEQPDLIVANDLDALPLAIRLGEMSKTPVVFDAHEYAPGEFDDSWKWRLLRQPYAAALCRRYVPRAAAVTTVGEAIADAYAGRTGVRPEVITNAPEYHADLRPRPTADRVRLIHHGAAIPARKIENMVRLAPLLDRRFELNFMLVDGIRSYREGLERMAAGDPRVRFLPPVPMADLPVRLNEFDVGVFLLEPTNFNYRNALPNKFFEFLQARLAIAIGPTPEMARIVRATGTGIVAEDFGPESLARELNRLTVADVARFKQAAHAAAREYSAETNRDKWLAICRRVMAAKASGAVHS